MKLDFDALEKAFNAQVDVLAESDDSYEQSLEIAIHKYLEETGMVMVPRKPTSKMLDAVVPRPAHWPALGEDKEKDAAMFIDQMACAHTYRAMIAAFQKQSHE